MKTLNRILDLSLAAVIFCLGDVDSAAELWQGK